MDAVSIIIRKRDGHEMSRDEIRYFVQAFTDGTIPDYQAAAWLMAIYLQGMSRRETVDLTLAMTESGEQLDLSDAVDFAVDKHSSGGVGDKTSLVVLPLVTASGVPVAKMSGRGLDFSGGTLDKLESISGFRVELSRAEFVRQAREHKIVLAGQTAELAPADGKLYALRDVTGTVPSTPLIASSIMSKKLAGGADGIVLDVKVGSGAFMPTVETARELARIMVEIGVDAGRKMTALISDMNQPLGHAVGNALEVKEAIATLHGNGPADFEEHCVVVASHMLRLAGQTDDENLEKTQEELSARLQNGEAWKVFHTLIAAQGGDVKQIEQPDLLPQAPVIREIAAPRTGYLKWIDAREIGLSALDLGAGRKKKGDAVDMGVGIVVHHKVGNHVSQGDLLFEVHANSEEAADIAEKRVSEAHQWSDEAVEPLPVFHDVIKGTEVT